MIRFILFGLLFIFIVSMLGECDNQERSAERSNRTPYKWNSSLGVEPQKKNPRKIRMPAGTWDRDNDYLTSEELLQNIENAEVKGMGDDAATLEYFKDELR